MVMCLSILLAVLPVNEAKIIDRVAQEYALTEEQTYLLAAIRLTEQGKTPIEFGVGQDYPGHRATRYVNSPVRSFWIQAKWAAGTVKKRYTGDIPAFSKIYCPKNHEIWAKNVMFWYRKQMTLKGSKIERTDSDKARPRD